MQGGAAAIMMTGCHPHRPHGVLPMTTTALLTVAALAVISAHALGAADLTDASATSRKALPNGALGSPAFYPSGERPVGWRGDGTGRYPGATPPIAWERRQSGGEYLSKGILWMTHMPAGSIASPTIVGERIFVCSNFSDLICVDKKSGRILWSHANGYYEAARDSDRADPAFQAKVEPLAAEVAKLDERFIAQSNAQISPSGPTPAQEEAFADLAKQKRDKEVQLIDAMRRIDGKRYIGKPYEQHCGSSSGTPCSDGKFIYASFLGGIYTSAMSVVCYDLSGKRQWMNFIEKVSANEHGNHSSMLLLGNRLIFFANNLTIAFDKATGKELWRNSGGDGDYTDGISVPRPFKFDGEDAIFRAFTHANILRVADGKELAQVTQLYFLWSTPLIEDGVAFWGDRAKDRLLIAEKLPSRSGEAAKPLYTVNAPAGSLHTEVVASPLLYDGL